MADSFRRPYLDSSVFFAHVKQEVIECPDGLKRWEVAHGILTDARSGLYKVFTSTVTLAEVRRIKVKNEVLNEDELEAVRNLFAHEYIQVIEVNREIGEEAQRLGATYGITPMDSLHLATAIWWECDIFLYWDKALAAALGPGPIENVVLAEPYWPRARGGLPMGWQPENNDSSGSANSV